LIEIINKQLLLQLVGYLCYWQMGFNSVFKGLILTRKLKSMMLVSSSGVMFVGSFVKNS